MLNSKEKQGKETDSMKFYCYFYFFTKGCPSSNLEK